MCNDNTYVIHYWSMINKEIFIQFKHHKFLELPLQSHTTETHQSFQLT
jgi:hypothetical protein